MNGLSFHHWGPSIPFDLIRAQEQGDVVFLCGAGISMPELPGFIKLVEDIYQSLGESWTSHPAEAEGMKCPDKFKAPDRTLNALAERMGDGGDAIRRELSKALSSTLDHSEFHFDLMRLSRGIRDHRIITTNFDTLFERSWASQGSKELESHCTSGMPGPGSTRWRGVFHLHGRILDPKTPTLAESELVLTSAEFGDAYLRSGWASRYLYDLLRHSHVVIVGYSLNDPPTRYLFDALAADRKRFEFKDLYAIVADEDNETELIEVWRGRQAIPLIYKAPLNRRKKERDYSALRTVISAWAKYADDPTSWAKSRLQKLFRLGIKRLTDSDWQSLDWILSRHDNDRLLEEANPSSRWLEILWERRNKRQRTLEFGPWIAKRLAERSMIDAVLKNQGCLTPISRYSIENEIYRNNSLSSTRRSFWLALCASVNDAENAVKDGHLRLSLLLRLGPSNSYVRGLISDYFRPIPFFRQNYSSGRRSGHSISQIANVEFKLSDSYINAEEVFKRTSPPEDEDLLFDLIQTLKSHLRKQKTIIDHPNRQSGHYLQ